MASSTSAKCDDQSHRIFVELCVNEVMKGNRPNMTLSAIGWENVHAGFKARTKKEYTIKQLKNHWDLMKSEHQLFKQLRSGFTGLGWDEVNKTIAAPATWWDQRIEENPKFRRFRGKDLSVYWFSYDDLFGDIVATGDRARAASQREVELDASMAEATYTELPDEEERSGDSDDAVQPTQNLFPTASFGKSKISSGSKKKENLVRARQS